MSSNSELVYELEELVNFERVLSEIAIMIHLIQ